MKLIPTCTCKCTRTCTCRCVLYIYKFILNVMDSHAWGIGLHVYNKELVQDPNNILPGRNAGSSFDILKVQVHVHVYNV